MARRRCNDTGRASFLVQRASGVASEPRQLRSNKTCLPIGTGARLGLELWEFKRHGSRPNGRYPCVGRKQREIPEFKSFKEGIQNLHRVTVGTSGDGQGTAAPVTNPERYLRTAEDAVREAVKRTPRRVTFSVARDSSSNKLAREFLEQEYRGRCQVTGQTFAKRTGGNYFEALSLVSRLDAEHLNDAGNMLCLSADVAAQFMHAEFAWIDSIEEKILNFKAEKRGGTEEMRKVSVRVAGKTLTITWSERHFIRLCALWNAV